jgi:hypothetical protein
MRQNFIKLLKTHVEKMSAFRLSRMFMKQNELNHSLQDVDENKGESRWAQSPATVEASACVPPVSRLGQDSHATRR